MDLTGLYNREGKPHDRYALVGASGSGKSTLAGKLSRQIDSRHVELDAFFWLPDWQMCPTEEFRQLVARACSGERWIVDGNYSIARDVIWQRAEAVVWLDLPFHVVMAQVFRRTLGRCITGRPLWNDNRASFRRAFFSRHSILWYAAKTWKKKQELYSELLSQPRWAHLDIYRVRTRDLSDIEVRRGRLAA